MTNNKMPEGRENQCTARNKTCRECGYRFKKGDKSWHCKKCGEPRRCTNNAVENRNTCKVHGGPGGRPPSIKYKIASQFFDAFQHLKMHPELLSLATEISLVGARQDQLMERLEAVDTSFTVMDMNDALQEMEDGLRYGNNTLMARGLANMRKAMSPANVERSLITELFNNFEVTRRLIDTERKWATANKQTMEIALVLELMMILQRVMFKYMTPEDRAECAKEIRGYLPSRADITLR